MDSNVSLNGRGENYVDRNDQTESVGGEEEDVDADVFTHPDFDAEMLSLIDDENEATDGDCDRAAANLLAFSDRERESLSIAGEEIEAEGVFTHSPQPTAPLQITRDTVPAESLLDLSDASKENEPALRRKRPFSEVGSRQIRRRKKTFIAEFEHLSANYAMDEEEAVAILRRTAGSICTTRPPLRTRRTCSHGSPCGVTRWTWAPRR